MKNTTANKNATTVKVKRGLIHDKIVTTTYDAEGNVISVSESQGKASWLTIFGCGVLVAGYTKLIYDCNKMMADNNDFINDQMKKYKF